MNIDKNKLKLGVWLEDKDGNKSKYTGAALERSNKDIRFRYVCEPVSIMTHMYVYYDNKDICKHPLRYRRRTHGWIKGIKGCICENCGKTKTGKALIPFAFMGWDKGNSAYELGETTTHLSKMSQRCAVAMVNSGDYELDEALVIMASACERCMNVLFYTYLNGADGYAEYSEAWQKCNSNCDFCKGGN